MPRFDGKVAFITGAARGQGREHALRLAAGGADVVLVDACAPFATTGYEASTSADLAQTVRLVEAEGRRALPFEVDVRDSPAMIDAARQAAGELGRLDLVVANAGICSYGRLWELTDEQWHEMLDVNLTGVWHTIRAVVPALIEAGNGGSVVLTSSGAGLKGLPMLGHYGATKHALVGLARSLANEVAEFGIRVNTVHPTAVRTPMGNDPDLVGVFGKFPQFRRSFGNMLPVGKVDASDITDAVAWLLSDEARYVTGVALPVDAGANEV